MYKAVLFDFDGVLTYDANDRASIADYVSSRVKGISKEKFLEAYEKYSKQLNCGEITNKEIWNDLCAELGKKIDRVILRDAFINTPIDHDMMGLVRRLKDSGYITGIITNNTKDRMEVIKTHFDLNEIFDHIVVSAEVGSCKDDPEIFRHMIRRSALKTKECIYMDNNEMNLIAPRKMRIKTIFFDHEKRESWKLIRELRYLGLVF